MGEYKIHLGLSDTKDGIIEVWQDGVKIINTKGRTLPTQNSIINRLEVGISASSRNTILYVDDISISDKPIVLKDVSLKNREVRP